MSAVPGSVRSWVALLAGLVALACGGESPEVLPRSLPASSSLGLFPSSVFAAPIPAGAAVHPDSDLLEESLVASSTLILMTGQYTFPVYFAGASSPRAAVALPCAGAWELGVTRLLDVPIPSFALAGDDDPAEDPSGCGEDSPSDDLMVVVDRARGCEYDFWQARRGAGGAWEASWMAAHETGGAGVFPGGLSARASGFAYLAGAVWPDEIASGEIPHALAISYPYTRAGGPVAPAASSDGITESGDAIPIGARIRLRPDLELDALGLAPHERTIARALQVYGAFVVDTGGESGIAIYGVDRRSAAEDPWSGIVPDGPLVYLDAIPLDELEVLDFGAQDPDVSPTLPENRCTSFE